MKQPELGNKVNEIRNAKGLTQKELSNSCNVDIRTIQRIEAGEVIPRWSTLRIIAAALEIDEKVFNGNEPKEISPAIRQLLFISFTFGIIYFINQVFYSNIIPGSEFTSSGGVFIFMSIIHLVAGVLFYYGFYLLGKYKRSKFLEVASIIIMVLIPMYVITDMIILGTTYSFTIHIKRIIVIQLGIAGILFGIGLLNTKGKNLTLYRISGLLQILIGSMLIVQVSILQLIGLWLSIPFILLLLCVLLIEYQEFRISALAQERGEGHNG